MLLLRAQVVIVADPHARPYTANPQLIPTSSIARTEQCACGLLITAIPNNAAGITDAVKNHRAAYTHRSWSREQHWAEPITPRTRA